VDYSRYSACRDAVEKCRLEKPVIVAPKTIYFDSGMLRCVREYFGRKLFDDVMSDIEKEEGGWD